MKIDHIIDADDDTMLVKVPVTKTCKPRSFIIAGVLREIVKVYMSLRPSNCTTDRFFLNYRGGKCTVQPVGKSKFGEMPKIIAAYLKLPNCKIYTGHSFRRTSATLLADAGADLLELKRHGSWTSVSVVEGYIGDSVQNKKRTHLKIVSGIDAKRPKFNQSACLAKPSSVSVSTDSSGIVQPESMSVSGAQCIMSANSDEIIRTSSSVPYSTKLSTMPVTVDSKISSGIIKSSSKVHPHPLNFEQLSETSSFGTDINLNCIDSDRNLKGDSILQVHPILQCSQDLQLDPLPCDDDFVPEHIKAQANEVVFASLPVKSKKLYTRAYNEFKKWRSEKVKTNSFAEEVLMVYFQELSKKYVASSLSAIYSMLRATFSAFDNINIKTYYKLLSFINMKNKTYQANVSKSFSKEHIVSFLNQASDEIHLINKVIFITSSY